MKARIDFEVKNEEEFEKLKECSKLPNEKWSLLSEKENIELNKLIEMKTCYVNEEDICVELPKDDEGIELYSNDIYFPIIHIEDVEKLLDKRKQEQEEKGDKIINDYFKELGKGVEGGCDMSLDAEKLKNQIFGEEK